MATKNRINSSDIAKMTGISRATVSYVINNRTDQSISEETRRRVLVAIEQSGYRPNLAARALASGKTMTIALWVPITNRSVSGHFINHIGKLARADGYHSVVVEIFGETPDSLSQAGLIDPGAFDAILAVDASGLIDGLLDRFANMPPIVSMGPAFTTRVDHVGVDLAAGSAMAMKHLIDTGRKRIVLLADQRHQYPGDPRFDAYSRGMESIGQNLEVIPLPFVRYDDAYRAVYNRFDRSLDADALFCFNDECAIAANKALHDLGIRAPDQISIVGSDGIDETLYCIPGITTVAQPFEEVSRLAWQYLRRRLDDPGSRVIGKILQMKLIVRGSAPHLKETY